MFFQTLEQIKLKSMHQKNLSRNMFFDLSCCLEIQLRWDENNFETCWKYEMSFWYVMWMYTTSSCFFDMSCKFIEHHCPISMLFQTLEQITGKLKSMHQKNLPRNIFLGFIVLPNPIFVTSKNMEPLVGVCGHENAVSCCIIHDRCKFYLLSTDTSNLKRFEQRY